jgi:CubicO group peptidase (beta-lactamase class C family)/D-alanyl-D-alanine dipeptidase
MTTLTTARRAVAAMVVATSVLEAQPASDAVAPQPRYAAASAILERFVEHEMADKGLPALSIALVEDQTVVWARGFGVANSRDSTRATARTVYRVGSVSKLFTDIGVMQLVERGALDLDVPVTRYLPRFRPSGAGASAITLRELMSHRSGLVREPPAGHYFDNSGPTLDATVGSLNDTRLVYAPKATAKYSNAGIAVAGLVLQTASGQRFPDYLARSVLRPMGLDDSAFEPESSLAQRLATASMWTLDGRTFVAPTFQLGMAPAGSMYSTVMDLGRFMSMLFARGKTASGRLMSDNSLAEMWRPQFAPRGATAGFGLGFDVSALDGHRMVRHGGAIYGFATELAALPDDKLGVAVAITKDGTNAVASRIAGAALRLMIASKGSPLPEPQVTSPVPLTLARQLDGSYGDGRRRIDVTARDSTVYLTRTSGVLRSRLRVLTGDTLVVDDELSYGPRVRLLGRRLIVGDDTLARVTRPKPENPPARWRGLIGEYGWDYNTLYILERDGRLHALIEWFFDYPLTESAGDTFAFPASGLYDGERLSFRRRADGYATEVRVGGVVFPRRPIEGEDGRTFRLRPLHPVGELRAEALAATPPVETGPRRASDLVDLATLDSTIRFDIRYATTNNFMGTPMYQQARAFLQRPAAEALLRAHRALARHGLGLLIHDAYRPWYVTKMFWDATPDSARIFVADPSRGSRHNRGAAVDLTLYYRRTSRPIEMVSGYDEFSARAYPDYPGGTSRQRYDRELLRRAMEAEGFRVYEAEWWHFDYQDWRLYPIGNQTFDQIRASP